jgi:hypothetical protein
MRLKGVRAEMLQAGLAWLSSGGGSTGRSTLLPTAPAGLDSTLRWPVARLWLLARTLSLCHESLCCRSVAAICVCCVAGLPVDASYCPPARSATFLAPGPWPQPSLFLEPTLKKSQKTTPPRQFPPLDSHCCLLCLLFASSPHLSRFALCRRMASSP